MADFDAADDAAPGEEPDDRASWPRFCFVLARTTDPCDPTAAREAVAEIFGPEFSAEVTDDTMVAVACGAETIGFLALMPIPIPGGEAEVHADGNFLWPNGREEAAAHRAHVIVTVAGGSADSTPVESALALSKLALVALRLFDGIGVYWGAASVCNSRPTFESACEGMNEEQLPVLVWLRFQFIRDDDGATFFYTLGMPPFGLMDIEVDRVEGEPGELFGFVVDIAHYLLQSGPVIADGNTVGGSEEERIVVRHQPSRLDPSRMVHKVYFGSRA